ncbi:uncharacterized protein NECHADRAFT_88293 [Fusarium vanettenii 77-13-4]|uniref:NmrA-like domain-containing protein n=1 Tax=Fusarium vanettenii (strain ATCC MYA-4622 / CBS 123669 / FGSC 9596 / NRRL 45880 / 77-13-4) TaxID=660122 RepID=C7ZE25_FUSV7|nr:uncharacterized protein NECHADRAFT_88293 [Fusarium vanettenii 77-13-4]EEU37947.1 hypothetical protein NECHADRAFT_88293 [Fusarium vanettenii 77-13-4]
MGSIKVAVAGATGETGSSIIRGLLASTTSRFQVTALVRPSSLSKPEVLELKEMSVKVVGADLTGPEGDLEAILTDIDVVISAVNATAILNEIPLINAAKSAGVGRYVPCFFATVVPPNGILRLRDGKEVVLNHIKKVYLPYTVIDVGWWYQIALPRVPSGRLDKALAMPAECIPGDGNTPSAMTDVKDIGRYVARVIADPQTLNRMVFAYTELHTTNQVYDIVEKQSDEKIERKYMAEDEIKARAAAAQQSNTIPGSLENVSESQFQYWNSWGIRGDNTPEFAKYLGYLLAKELYPDLEGRTLEAYVKDALDGKEQAAWQQAGALYTKNTTKAD